MSELGEFYKEQNERRQKTAATRRKVAAFTFQVASALAIENGLELLQHTEIHYSLRSASPKWQKEVYPGNQRIWAEDRVGPYLRLPSPWTLVDVVQTAIDAMKKEKA